MDSKPAMPDLTQAQIISVAKILIGAILAALDAFGAFHINDRQQAALFALVAALVVAGGTLMTADAYLRGKRNLHLAQVASSANYAAEAQAVKAMAEIESAPVEPESVPVKPKRVRKAAARKPPVAVAPPKQ